MKQQQGFFQIVAIMMIMLMATIGLVLVVETGNQANISASLQNGLQAYYLAQAGMQVAKRQLGRADSSRVTCDALSGTTTVTNATFGEGTFTATATRSNTTITTLTAAISSSSTTIPVTSTTGFASSGLLVLGSEYLYYGAISGNNFIGVARGVQGSTTAAATSGSGLSQHQCTVSVSAGIPSNASPAYQASFTQYLNVAYAYIANSGTNLISICPVYANNNTLNSCVTHADASFNKPFQVILNKAATMAYVLNNNNKVSVCALNTNGTMGTCTAFTDVSFAFSYSGGSLNAAGTFLYVTNYTSNKVSICPVNGAGALSTCATTTSNSTFNGPNDIVLAGSYAYVANANSNRISICPVNANGTLGTCSTSKANNTLRTPGSLGVDVHNTYLYIVNEGNNQVSICPINANGTLGTCSATTGNGTFNFDVNTTANCFISNANFAYFTNSGNNTIAMCPINANGTLGTCTTDTDTSYNIDNGIAISYGKII